MRRKRTPSASALTDIAFLLLLFFLILAVTTRQLPADITLPHTASAQKADESSPTLTVNDQGKVFLEQEAITIRAIPFSETYTLIAHRDTPFTHIAPVLEHLRSLNVEVLECIVEER
ncbi:MAG: biopolymer transporter ExbD [Sphaerochaetaceae bacterium]|nr:biopolymer transporter ExbD [Sphaerochaetaceae bacterium]